MTTLAWLISFMLPACGAEGAAGLPVPPPMDMTRIERPRSPNTALAGPAGMTPPPDIVVPPWPITEDALFATARTVFAGEPRTYVAAEYGDRHQVHFVARSELMNFPDRIAVQTVPDGKGGTSLIIWSRSVYGWGDHGVNRARVEAWLAALDAAAQPSRPR